MLVAPNPFDSFKGTQVLTAVFVFGAFSIGAWWAPSDSPVSQQEQSQSPRAPTEHPRVVCSIHDDIAVLVRQLGDPDFSIRERATNELKRIAVPALTALRAGAQSTDLEVRLRAQRLLPPLEYQAKIGMPVIVNGARFEAFADRLWRLPPKNGQRKVKMGVKVTNCRRTPFFLYLDGFGPDLRTERHTSPIVFGGRDCARFPDVREIKLQPGESYTVSHFDAKLIESTRAQQWVLQVSDAWNGQTVFEGIVPGRYYLSMGYENRIEMPIAGAPLWTGSVATNPIEIIVQNSSP